MLKKHTGTGYHIITVYNDMLQHMAGDMGALAKNKTQWKQDLYFVVKFAWQKLCNIYAEVNPMTCLHLI